MIQRYLIQGILALTLFGWIGFGVYKWHYEPIRNLTKKIQKQSKEINDLAIKTILLDAKLTSKTFEKNQVNEKMLGKERLHENKDINLSDGWHTINL